MGLLNCFFLEVGGLRGSGLDALLLDPVVFPAAPTAFKVGVASIRGVTVLKNFFGVGVPSVRVSFGTTLFRLSSPS